MKKYILLNIFLLMVNGLNAQITASNVISMIDSNSRWTSKKTSAVHEAFITSYNFKIKPDSSVGNITYGKVTRNDNYNDSKFNNFFNCFEIFGKFYLLKKPTNLKINPNAGDLIYDFNAKPKDSLITRFLMFDSAYYKGIVDSIGIELIAGKSRKTVYFSPKFYRYKDPFTKEMTKWETVRSNENSGQKWVEGIGDMKYGLFDDGGAGGVIPPLIGPSYGYPLVCYEYNGELLYKNKSYARCDFKDYYPNEVLKGQSTDNSLNIFPNPTNATLGIQTSIQIAKLLVYQSNGIKVMESKATENLDVSALPEGLYLLEALDTEGRRILKKFEKR